MAYQGRNFGLHQTCVRKAQEKFDLEAAVTALRWIEAVNGRRLRADADVGSVRSEREVADLLKDGTALCEVMNHVKPGAVKKYHKNPSAFQQMENAELFLRACVEFGMQTIDTFHVKELYEARAVYTVINCIFALGSLAQKHGYTGPRLGVKLASRNERRFTEQQLQLARRTVSRQHSGPTDGPSQAHMTPYGLPRQILQPTGAATATGGGGATTTAAASAAAATSTAAGGGVAPAAAAGVGSGVGDRGRSSSSSSPPSSPTRFSRCGSSSSSSSSGIIGLQYRSNQVASQKGMTAYGMPRQIFTTTTTTTNNDDDNEGNPPHTTNDTTTSAPTTPTSPPARHNPILNSKPPPRQARAPGNSSSDISLQYGSNRAASQRGMTAYGMPRQIVASTSSVTSVEENGEGGGGEEKGDDVF